MNKALKSTILLFIAVCFLASCSQKYPDSPEGVVLKADFNKESGEGLEKRGLDLMKDEASTELAADKAWFSNKKDFSVSVWVKSESQTSDTTIILSNADFRTKPMGIYGNRRLNKGISLYSYKGGWGWNIGNGNLHYNYEPVAEKQPVADNKWHQLAFTYSSKDHEMRLYYDGDNKAVLHIGDLRENDFKSDYPLRIGGDSITSPPYRSFQGTLDVLNVWAKTISSEDIQNEFEFYSKTEVNEPEMEDDIFTLVNWNIWHGGTHYTKEKDGFDGIERTIELIENADADIVLMQETYGAGSRISSMLGFYYYEASSAIGAVWGANLSVMSRFPIDDVYMIEEASNYGKNYAFNNGGSRIRLSDNKGVIVFSNWYNGRKPEDLDGALSAWTGLIENAEETPLIFGGDYNSVSHLDDGIGESGHSKLMTGAEFTDSYRHVHPDVESHPGYSFHTSTRRIDYIYFKGNKLEAIEVKPIVPNFKGIGELTPGYPSDHLGIVARFKIN